MKGCDRMRSWHTYCSIIDLVLILKEETLDDPISQQDVV